MCLHEFMCTNVYAAVHRDQKRAQGSPELGLQRLRPSGYSKSNPHPLSTEAIAHTAEFTSTFKISLELFLNCIC